MQSRTYNGRTRSCLDDLDLTRLGETTWSQCSSSYRSKAYGLARGAQVAHLSDEYQWMSRERIDDVEMQKKRRAERPDEDVGWMYPARWKARD